MRNIIPLSFLLLATGLFGQNTLSSQPFSIGETFELDSKVLGEKRTLNVYLPAGYSAGDTTRYAVIYLLDGSADEDFIHIAGLVQFCNFPWVNILPPSIVVGIANIDRKHDLTFPTSIEADKKQFPTTGGAANFMEFIEVEVQPFVEQHYRTNSSRSLIGQSLGGLFATEVLLKKPALFSNYFVVSPSLWWDGESLLKNNLSNLTGKKLTIHISVGNEGKVMKRDAKRLYKKLKALKNSQLTLGYNYLGKEDHASILHLAMYEAFKWFQSVSSNPKS
ncbi:MAG: alpha/beta hydrolase [Lewinellaceae bacterium]|nr:alpha/beta hydrolase [Saprospiraceae bacterium]MCB9341469.1 alpha/beta hydrolase [Lewinellaceae bacterium]